MADRGDAQLAQILGSQPPQYVAVDIIVAECGRVSFEPQPAQPRCYIHTVVLGPEERQHLIKEDILLPFGVPVAALKYALCRVLRALPR